MRTIRWGATALVIALVATGVSWSVPASASPTVEVIVQGAGPEAASAVEAAGGSVVQDLGLVQGFVAEVPESYVAALRSRSDVRAVTPNYQVTFQSAKGVDGNAAPPSNAAPPGTAYRGATRADRLQAKTNTKGRGSVIALLDTGVADVPDLAGRVVPVTHPGTGVVDTCMNLSPEPTCGDSFGHGTFVAGLIAGNGASSGGLYRGVAPEASLISIKVAGRDGSAEVSQVILGIQWAVAFHDQYGIDVLNLSLGFASPNSYKDDPLNYAVERAWAAGITVVVSAGNTGTNAETITKPGDDPFVITVGATDDKGTIHHKDDDVASFSARGTTFADGLAKPDLVAPGYRLTSLRAPGSHIEQQHPTGVDATYRRGTGTSMSAAVVSGGVALMLERRPGLTPDQVKFALMATTKDLEVTDPSAVGTGQADFWGATYEAPAGLANQGLERSKWFDAPLEDAGYWNGVNWNGVNWNGVNWNGVSWAGVNWHGVNWNGVSWHGVSWAGVNWNGVSWNGVSWVAADWDGVSWAGVNWNGVSWAGVSWNGVSWNGVSWNDVWSGVSWNGVSWNGVSWAGVSWNGARWD